MNIPLFIVADRGGLKAYQISHSNYHSSATLLETFCVEAARARLQDQLTDKAGAFSNSGHRGTSAAERMTLTAENEIRGFRAIATHLIGLLRAYRPTRWAFAAPSEINSAILDGLPPTDKHSLVVNLPLDLVNTPPESLLSHLDSPVH